MKIAMFHELPNKSGSRKSVNEIARRLKKRNTVDLFYVDSKKNSEEKRYFSQIKFYKFIPVVWNGKNWKNRIMRDSIELLKLYFLHKKIAGDIKKRKYDVIFIHGSKFTESPFLLRFNVYPKVYYAHASNYLLVNDLPKNISFIKTLYERINRLLRKKIDIYNVQSAHYIFSNSKFTQKEIKKLYNKKSSVLYLGVDQRIFKPSTSEKKYDILFIGSKEKVDGYHILEDALKMVKKHPRVYPIFIEEQWIDNPQRLKSFYQRSKITACLAKKEPFGLVAVESMSCGVPVLAVNDGGYVETVIHGKTGYIIHRDPQSLAKKIDYLLSKPSLLHSIGKNAVREVREHWTWEKRVKEMENNMLKIARN